MKKCIFGILMIFIFIGCGRYIEPENQNNLAVIIIDEKPKLKNRDGVIVGFDIDEKFVHYTQKRVKLKPGNHKIFLEITAYYNGRAKYSGIEKFDLYVKANHIYKIKVERDREVLNKLDENVNAEYIIYDNSTLVIKKSIQLVDSTSSNPSDRFGMGVNNSSSIDPMVLDSIIYHTVVMPL